MRLNQYLAQATGLSRRAADILIQKACVEVDGQLAVLGQDVSDKNLVKYYKNNQWVNCVTLDDQDDPIVLFYKPIFCITSRNDPEKRKTIYDLLPKIYHKLKPAGRLDYMSEGLMILSSNGDLVHKLTHPSNNSIKTYMVGLKEALTPEMIAQAAKGMNVEGIDLVPVTINKAPKSQLTEYNYLKLERHLEWYEFVLGEGRNNQIRNMCGSWGQRVHRLIRLTQGEYRLTEGLHRQKILTIETKKVDTKPKKRIFKKPFKPREN